MRQAITAVCLIFGLLSTDALAVETTQEMLSACRAFATAEVSGDTARFPQNFDTGICWGAFTMIQKVIIDVDENRRPIYGVCARPKSRLIQLIAIFPKYAENTPQRLHEHFSRVAFESLQKAFRCKGRR